LAVQVLGVQDPGLRAEMAAYKDDLTETVGEMDERVRERSSDA